MARYNPFNDHTDEYEEWFERYPCVFETELAAIKKLWPAGENIKSLEIGSGTGRFAKALNITEGIEPAANMAMIAEKNGISIMPGIAESLPYQDQQFDIVLINFCISYFENVQKALLEAFGVLKPGGYLILGFIDKGSTIGKYYESKRMKSVFYRQARFFSPQELEKELKDAGFRDPEFSQTLFHSLEDTKKIEFSIPGYGKGSYVLVKAYR